MEWFQLDVSVLSTNTSQLPDHGSVSANSDSEPHEVPSAVLSCGSRGVFPRSQLTHPTPPTSGLKIAVYVIRIQTPCVSPTMTAIKLRLRTTDCGVKGFVSHVKKKQSNYTSTPNSSSGWQIESFIAFSFGF
ncbi:uncharacterized protein FOMMEDRAFT_155495 [Fomitiporia mediterranea MF3/22]|uniref:uncharacterized protein n=1 Tax=Fomitiporia mediterranea (strain MF3/22) TaxID=694068 RepID=UPI0004407777|nr:uncharacterized protein FOMMEDRAFT_155495 [Fomitiporia mediterranea MF3/22]EJD04366.1 hypothetical protein FOMMEDRAFT_155495 [Fomitiporia mediterranea MF3/22]